MMDGTDADGEWSDEEVVRSGSNTGVSETEGDEQHRSSSITAQPHSGLGLMTSRSTYSLSGSETGGLKDDPVISILDKIDAEIELIGQVPSLPSPLSMTRSSSSNGKIKHKNGSSSKPRSTYKENTCSHVSVLEFTPTVNQIEEADTGLGTSSAQLDHASMDDRINGTAEIYSEACLTDAQTDEDTLRRVSDAPSDLDSVAAQQIDSKFKEIMRKKKVPPDLPVHPGKPTASLSLTPRLRQSRNRPSATMLSTGYGTDNDSIRTEDFEMKFQNLMVTSDNEKPQDLPVNTFIDPRRKSHAKDKAEVTFSDVGTTPKIPLDSASNASSTRKQVPAEDDILSRLLAISRSPTQSTTHASNSAPQTSSARPRSLSPTRLRSDKKTVSIQDVGYDQDLRDIERESLRIQRDMERERRARSASPAPAPRDFNRSIPMYSPRKTDLKPNIRIPRAKSPQIDSTTDIANIISETSAKYSIAEDQALANHELKTLRQAMLVTKKELKEAEGDLKNARELAEDARSGLMIIEFKRGNATKDLERLVDDLRRKKNQLTSLEAEIKGKSSEVKTMHSLGLTREDCLEVKTIKEENVCLKTKMRTMEGLHLERDELARQLDAVREDLLREQKQTRLHKAEFQEEMELIMSKLEETQSGWGDGQLQLTKLEAAYRKMEKEKNQIIQEKILECEDIKQRAKEESAERKNLLGEEMNGLEMEVNELRVRVKDVHEDNYSKDEIIERLRAQISEMQSVLTKERQDRHTTSSEQKKALQRLKKETSSAVLKLKESMFLDRQKAMEELRSEVEKERRDNGIRSDDRLTHVLSEHSREIQDKNDELMRLQDKIRRIEGDKQIEAEQQMIEAVNRERDRLEKDKEWQTRQLKEEANRRSSELMAQVEREKQSQRELHREMTDLRKELDEQRRLQREASKEKLIAVSKAKDQMKEQNSAETERIRNLLKEEHKKEVDRLQERLRGHEEELSKLQNQKYEVSHREKCAIQALENAERTVISELNEECYKVSKVLGISPRRVEHTSFHLETADGKISPSFKNRPVLNTALANLRAGNEELISHIAELQQEVESLRTMVETVTKEKEEAIENCRLQMEKQKTLDLEKLKDKLLKEHVQEMSNVIRECAESNNQLKSNNHHLKRYGDAALMEALQAKEDELHTLQSSMTQWQAEAEEKFSTKLQLLMAKEREKYQALQHHSTREQKRISDLQKREIDRLEREVTKLTSMSQNNVIDSNRYASTSSSLKQQTVAEAFSPIPEITPSLPSPSTKQTPNSLQERIKQLQKDNDLLRKQRIMNNAHMNNSSYSYVEKPGTSKAVARSLSPTRDLRILHRLEERMRMGEEEALKTEEKAKLDQKMLNNKIAEMNRLQDKLSLQNKELQELERSYSNLHKNYNSSRPVSPTRILNTTM